MRLYINVEERCLDLLELLETKLKILAIIYHNEAQAINSYGYNVWTKLKGKFHSYLEERDLRNVYRHLQDLNSAGLVKRGTKQRALQNVNSTP